ncbi:MAG: type II toxin-antitoxin system RelE/ParE family toxin [Acidobacteriota bacterium]
MGKTKSGTRPLTNQVYKIEFSRKAERDFKNLEKSVQTRLKPKIDSLAKNPRPSGVKKLEGEEDLYRVRVGDYRIIYQIQDDKLIVLVVKIGDRKEIYKK